MQQNDIARSVKNSLRLRGKSDRTVEAYVNWIDRFQSFHYTKYPDMFKGEDIREFLFHLYSEEKASPATRNQALSAIKFLYTEILKKPFGKIEQAKTDRQKPITFSDEELQLVFEKFNQTQKLIAGLLLHTGTKLLECLTLRIRDIDFVEKKITVRDQKGFIVRTPILPDILVDELKSHLSKVRDLFDSDTKEGFGKVYLPFNILLKNPTAENEWSWQYVFPASRRVKDPKSGFERRHHLTETVIQRALKSALRESGIETPLNCHSFRHTYATNKLKEGFSIQEVQKFLGHKDIRNTMVYLE